MSSGTPGPTTDPVLARLAAMTPEDRVGQVFLIAFLGDDVDDGSDVASLVRAGRIGGVVLQASSGNVSNAPDDGGAEAVATTTRALQALALDPGGTGIPLFVAVDHEGDGAPLTNLREGFTPLPSAMAIGATWSPDLARTVGEVAGRELAAAGVNVLLGPVLDVLAEPRSTQRGDIGVRALGGDPYWVGRMGSAYIEGVHRGGGGRIVTVAKHFPGHGASDRLPDTEVATVTRSLAQLRSVELAPFEAVTAPGSPGALGVTDALMTSHIRYRGFQGNPRDKTPPISLDAAALGAVFSLVGSPLPAWRAAGGLTVSDSLGVRAIRRYDDPSETGFRHRDIARRALMAGNDVLILSQFAVRNEWRLQLDNIRDTLDYFAAEYRRDPAFAARVDDAARRILRQKTALYPEGFQLAAVTADSAGAREPETAVTAEEAVAAVAREALTVLHRPEGAAPQPGERIVVVTDDRGSLACPFESCGLPAERISRLRALGPTLVEGLILERFGPAGAGRVTPADVSSIGYCALQAALRPPELAAAADPTPLSPTPATVGIPPGADCDPAMAEETLAQLRDADWIVFGVTELNPAVVGHADAVESFLQLAGEFGGTRRTRLAVLCFGPPYLFEPTDLHKLDVVIAAYTKIPAGIEAAVNELFAGGNTRGAPPVSVEGSNYDLAEALEPDPERSPPMSVKPSRIPRQAALPATVVVSVGPILDHNGHPVPDGTMVTVAAEPAAEGVKTSGTWPQATVHTVDAMARATLRFATGGPARIHAEAGRQAWAEELALDVPIPATADAGTAQAPTLPVPPHTPAIGARRPGLGDLMMTLAAVVTVSAAWVASPWWRVRPASAQLTTILATAAGGLAAYVLMGTAAVGGWFAWLPTVSTVAIGLAAAAAASTAPYAAARFRGRA